LLLRFASSQMNEKSAWPRSKAIVAMLNSLVSALAFRQRKATAAKYNRVTVRAPASHAAALRR
jgi:hypothetical protein